MNEGRFILIVLGMFLSLIGTLSFSVSSSVRIGVMAIFIVIGVIALYGSYMNKNSGWMISDLFFGLITLYIVYVGSKSGFTPLKMTLLAVTLISAFISVGGIGTKENILDKAEKRKRRDSAGEEVTIQPLKELKEGEVLPGTKKVELYDYKTNKMYDVKEPVVNPKFAEKKQEEITKNKKFLASLTGQIYHTPECPQAKRIKASNKAWLKDKEEAKKKGYKKHSCVN